MLKYTRGTGDRDWCIVSRIVILYSADFYYLAIAKFKEKK